MPGYSITDADRVALKFMREDPSGIGGGELTEDQQQILLSLVDCYLDRLPLEASDRHRRGLRDEGIDGIYFAWVGAQKRRAPHYFRSKTRSS
ncbi:DUF3500 domain-containing protein [Rhodococcus sp. Leaf278]|uniref:DUF3500 domain-containing protein n=1 Tax=Rhodococcus sp. Leaf278 TaxID=1736319 RepID=UPI000AB19ACF|nr:DUF3500 domain-containing protein [Rhodococcus sp. Leaf278]